MPFRDPWILSAIVAVAAACLVTSSRMRRPTAPLTSAVRVGTRRAGIQAHLPSALRAVTLVALAGAAGLPPLSAEADGPSSRGATMAVLDVSGSMLGPGTTGARRIDDARAALAAAASSDVGLLGLVLFGETASVRVPLLADRSLALSALTEAEPDRPEEGTALGPAIALAANQLRAIEATTRRALIVTDGESNAGVLDAPTAARLAHALGIEVDIVALDAEPGARAWLGQVAAAGGGRVIDQADVAPAPPPRTNGPGVMVRWTLVAAAACALELACMAAGLGRLA